MRRWNQAPSPQCVRWRRTAPVERCLVEQRPFVVKVASLQASLERERWTRWKRHELHVFNFFYFCFKVFFQTAQNYREFQDICSTSDIPPPAANFLLGATTLLALAPVRSAKGNPTDSNSVYMHIFIVEKCEGLRQRSSYIVDVLSLNSNGEGLCLHSVAKGSPFEFITCGCDAK